MDEAQVMLWGNSKVDVVCLCRLKATEDIARSERKVNDGFQKFEKENLYSENAVSLKVLEKLMRIRKERKEDRNKIYVDETGLYITRPDAWNGRVLLTADTAAEWDRRRQTLLSTLYEKYLRRALACKSNVALDTMENVHTTEFWY